MEEDEQLEQLAGKVLRPSRRMGLEDLLASELATAALSDPLAKIRHVCEGVLLLGEEELREVGLSRKDMEELEKIYALTLAFQNAFIDRFIDQHGREVERSAVIQWPFGEGEVGEWSPWILAPGVYIHWYAPTPAEIAEREAIKKEPDAGRRFYRLTHGRKITIDSLASLRVVFVLRAMPVALRAMRKLITLVSADTFLQAMRILRARRREG